MAWVPLIWLCFLMVSKDWVGVFKDLTSECALYDSDIVQPNPQ